MKNYTQVYVNNCIEAAEHYCKAFGGGRVHADRDYYAEGNAA